MTNAAFPLRAAAFSVALLCLGGCANTYYDTLEQFGYAKRDLLVERVGAAQAAQEAAKDGFRDALEEFTSVVAVDGGDLEAIYDDLSGTLAGSERRARDVSNRIDAVESVSGALFDEWEAELDAYTSPGLRRSSERKLTETRANYASMMRKMRLAESRMGPVLAAFRDQVLFLKHNLNARAIASIRGEIGGIEADVARLIGEMEAAIAEANRFIEGMS